MKPLRTFIALDPGKEIRDRILILRNRLARTTNEVKWVEEGNIHLTLLFLGEVDERELMPVCRAVADVAAALSPFPLTVETLGCFPNLRRPRILWVGIGDGSQVVMDLHDRLEEPLLQLGCYRREERQYTPHITLGRLKGEEPTDNLVATINKNKDWQGGNTTIQEIHVMSSELTRDGPIYTILSRVKLR